MDFFKVCGKIGVKGDFQFFFLTDYADGLDHFSAEAQATFRELESYLPELRESIEISLPDEEAVLDEAEENSKYLNFISNTLDGNPVTSAVFYDYDMTVVNFWAKPLRGGSTSMNWIPCKASTRICRKSIQT